MILNTFKISIYKKHKDPNLDHEWQKLAKDASVGFTSIALRQTGADLKKISVKIEPIKKVG